VPRDALPLAGATFAGAPQRVEDPVRIGDLVERRRPLRAVAPARARVLRVALQLSDLSGLFVDVREEAARRLAVEAGRRDERVAALDALGPRGRLELDPVVPALAGREGTEAALGAR